MSVDFDVAVTNRINDLGRLADEHAEAKGQVAYLEEFKKSKLAILMKKYEEFGYKTAASQEREARADKEYIELLEGLRAAVEKSEKARWSLEVARIAVEVWRTRRADRRAEMGLT